jgi:outer membrane protein OmpA-like peptidoglycan-associated protein
VATPPQVTPTPRAWTPPQDWEPWPGWRPPSDWRPPRGWVPPYGWSPPPGWDPPREWVPRLYGWGWSYVRDRGWVVPVNWVPPPDFVVPPNWYYLPPDAYEAYGFYNPSIRYVRPGRARSDLVVDINMTRPYLPPEPPPVMLRQAAPPPPRPLPQIAPEVVEVTQREQVVEVLTRERAPAGERYDGPVLVTGRVHFDFDSYSIKPESFEPLDVIGEALINPPLEEAIINIEGHTDSSGSDEYNQKLSEQRAWSVKSYLVQKFGIDPNRLVIVGFGERAPIADNNSDRGMALNRRVEFENVTELYQAASVR